MLDCASFRDQERLGVNLFCQECGSKLDGQLRFCEECGAPVPTDAHDQTPAPPVVDPPPPVVVSPPPAGATVASTPSHIVEEALDAPPAKPAGRSSGAFIGIAAILVIAVAGGGYWVWLQWQADRVTAPVGTTAPAAVPAAAD